MSAYVGLSSSRVVRTAARTLAHGLRRVWRALPIPPCVCPSCGLPGAAGDLCGVCLNDLATLAGPRCARCALATPMPAVSCAGCATWPAAVMGCVAAADYAAPWDGLVVAFKSGRTDLVGALARQLAAAVQAHGVPAACLVPVPSSSLALRRRGYSPPALLARSLGRQLGWPVRHDLLLAGAPRAKQATLGRRERLAQRHGFRASPAAAGLALHLVDDVLTTGATLQAAAHALAEAGALPPWLLVAARTPPVSGAGWP